MSDDTNHFITYTFIPIARLGDDGQYRPSVKVLLNGQFSEWVEFELPFEEERFAMPYAREFARNMKTMRQAAVLAEIANSKDTHE